MVVERKLYKYSGRETCIYKKVVEKNLFKYGDIGRILYKNRVINKYDGKEEPVQ